jgi:glycosyltransferase involved in cell wall biosynthesis
VGPLRGGPSEMVRNLSRSLSRHGIEVHVATTDDNGPDTLDVPRGVPVQQDGGTYWYFPRQSRFYTFSWPLAAWLARHVADYDVVHIHALFSFATLPAAFWARRRRVPYIVRPLGTLSEWGMKNRRPWLKTLSFRFLESRILQNASAVHYTSDQERVEAEKLNVTTTAAIIANGLPDAPASQVAGRFRARFPELEGRRIVLFLSRLDAKKGLDLLFRAWPTVRDKAPQACLVVAGTGPAEFVARLKAEADTLGIGPDVLWAGFLQGEDKQAALADADVFVLPSYSENFGIAAAEAMAAGLPVVVSDQVGIHGDIKRARAGVIVSCDADQLALELVRLVNNSVLRRSMGQDGRSLALQSYSLDAVTRKLIRLYNRIASPTDSTSRNSPSEEQTQVGVKPAMAANIGQMRIRQSPARGAGLTGSELPPPAEPLGQAHRATVDLPRL